MIQNYKTLLEVPQKEIEKFDKLIREYREKYIRNSSIIVEKIFKENLELRKIFQQKNISLYIKNIRELVRQEYLEDEANLNAIITKDLHKILDTPKEILDMLLSVQGLEVNKKELLEKVREICGEYAGKIFPYIYRIALSNTQSRRSRAGKTFEAIIYKIYEQLEYDYDSQNKVGRKIFDDLGLGKKVDSILPNIEAFKGRRNKTIIGTMKTSLRERWQEVAEEIERTKIPEIHLLTIDEDISRSKAMEMANHNIIIVTFDRVANSEKIKDMKNIISFEEYLFEEIPSILNFWKDEQ